MSASTASSTSELPPNRPGDETPPGSAQSAEGLCPRCGGSGHIESVACPACGGSGMVTVIVGDA